MYLVQGDVWWKKEQLEELDNSSVKFFVENKRSKSVEIKYNIELDQQRIRRFVQGLDSSIRLMAGQITNAPNAALALRNFLPEFLEINKELAAMDQMIDTIDKSKLNGEAKEALKVVPQLGA